MKILNTKDDPHSSINVLVYGEPGIGKTSFAGTSARCFKPIFLSAESGLLSLKKLGVEVDYIPIKKFEDLVEAHNWLAMHKDAEQYDTVVIDSLTEIQDICMNYLLKSLQEKEQEKTDADELTTYVQPRIQDWGALNTVMAKTIKHFRDMPKNLIVTALSEMSTNEKTLETKIQPLLKGKIVNNISGYFDEVFYMYAKEVTQDGSKETLRLLSTENNGRWVSKDRSGMLKPLMRPDFCNIYNVINGKQTKKEK